jgi:hypothetical protein
VISVEDWALIRRLVADGVPQRQVARDLGVGRATVARAVASDGPPKYERAAVPTSFTPFESVVRQLLAMTPDMPATVIAEAVAVELAVTLSHGSRPPAAHRARLNEPAVRLLDGSREYTLRKHPVSPRSG